VEQSKSLGRPECLARCWRLGRLARCRRNAAQRPLQPMPTGLPSKEPRNLGFFQFISLLFVFLFKSYRFKGNSDGLMIYSPFFKLLFIAWVPTDDL